MASAHLTRQFDYRKFMFTADDSGFDSSTTSSTSSIVWDDGFEVLTITSTAGGTGDFLLVDGSWTGTASAMSLKIAGTLAWSFTGLDFDVTDNAADNGYTLEGTTYYGDMADLANMLSGNDTIFASAFSDRVAGFLGADAIDGGAGDDWIEGWAGSDTLYGGSGCDTVIGGSGADRIVFYTALSATSNLDLVKGFVLGTDKLVLDDNIFQAFAGRSTVGAGTLKGFEKLRVVATTAQLSGNGCLTYVTANDTLYYDANGSGAGDTAFAKVTLAGTSSPSASDFVVIA